MSFKVLKASNWKWNQIKSKHSERHQQQVHKESTSNILHGLKFPLFIPADQFCGVTAVRQEIPSHNNVQECCCQSFPISSVRRSRFTQGLQQKGRLKLLNRIISSLSIFSRDTLRRFNQSHIWRFYPATSCCCCWRRMAQEQEVGPWCSIWFWIGCSTLLIRSNLASHL